MLPFSYCVFIIVIICIRSLKLLHILISVAKSKTFLYVVGPIEQLRIQIANRCSCVIYLLNCV